MSPEMVYRMCTKKVRHLTKRDAKQALRNGGRRFAGCHVYRCPVCRAYHVGHKRVEDA